jgi:hypothetical protein
MIVTYKKASRIFNLNLQLEVYNTDNIIPFPGILLS